MRLLWVPLFALSGCLSIVYSDGEGANGGEGPAGGGGGVPTTGGGAEGGVGASGGEGASGGADGGNGGAGGGGPCDPGSSCRAIAEGAKGPFLLVRGLEGCPNGDVVEASGGLVFPDGAPLSFSPATCGCQCTLPGPVGCPGVTLTPFGNSDCTGLNTAGFTAQSLDCNADFEVGHPLGSLDTASLMSGTPFCVSDDGVPNIPDVVYADPMQLCVEDIERCDAASACVPDGQAYCVFGANGACPADFSVAVEAVRDDDLDDTRDCDCGCGQSSQPCSSSFELFSDQNCANAYGTTTVGSCIFPTAGGGVGSFRYAPSAQGTCGAPTPFLSGSVGYASVIFCCTQAPN